MESLKIDTKRVLELTDDQRKVLISTDNHQVLHFYLQILLVGHGTGRKFNGKGPVCNITTQYTDFVEIFNILLDSSTIYFSHFSGYRTSFVYSCHSIPECYNLFSGVKLSIRWFCFLTVILKTGTVKQTGAFLFKLSKLHFEIMCTKFLSISNESIRKHYSQVFKNVQNFFPKEGR